VVVDRRRLVREGLMQLLRGRPGIEIAAVVGDLSECRDAAADVIVLRHRTHPVGAPLLREVTFDDDQSFAAILELLLGTTQPPAPPRIPSPAGPAPRLTPRELEVMRAVANGLSTGQIAHALAIAPKSVDNHKQRIFAKLGVQNAARAVLLTQRAGLLSAEAAG
jgi:DNA-binding NarL/FixJ family response regulator